MYQGHLLVLFFKISLVLHMYHFCVFYRVCFIVYFIVYAAFVGFVRIKLMMMMMSVD